MEMPFQCVRGSAKGYLASLFATLIVALALSLTSIRDQSWRLRTSCRMQGEANIE